MATDNLLLKNRSSDYKVQIQPLQQKTLTHLPQRPKVDLAFSNLNYTVKQGKGEFFFVGFANNWQQKLQP
jgi:hypothetical protein